MIRDLKIESLRGIKQADFVDFNQLNIFIGPNGCGKSTVLDAIKLAVTDNPAQALVDAVVRRSSLNFSIKDFFSGSTML